MRKSCSWGTWRALGIVRVGEPSRTLAPSSGLAEQALEVKESAGMLFLVWVLPRMCLFPPTGPLRPVQEAELPRPFADGLLRERTQLATPSRCWDGYGNHVTVHILIAQSIFLSQLLK